MTGKALRPWGRQLERNDPEDHVASNGRRLVLANKKPRMTLVCEMDREGMRGGPMQA